MFLSLLLLTLHCVAGSPSVARVTQWITGHGGFVNEARMEPFESRHGLGIRVRLCPQCGASRGRIAPLYARTREATDDPLLGSDPLLLRVPYALHMHPFSALHAPATQNAVSLLLAIGTEYNTLLGVALALELRNASSQWRPYLDTLPVATTLPRFGSRMNDREVALLRALGNPHRLADRVLERRVIDTAQYHHVSRALPDLGLTADEWLFALALITSRAFGESPRDFARLRQTVFAREPSVAVLVPYLDLFNHQASLPTHANRYYYESRGGTMDLIYFATGCAPGDSLEPGDEILNSYHADDALGIVSFVFYGFLVPVHYEPTDDCSVLASRMDDIAHHLLLLDGSGGQVDALHAYAEGVRRIWWDYEFGGDANPLLVTLMAECESRALQAIQTIEALQQCH